MMIPESQVFDPLAAAFLPQTSPADAASVTTPSLIPTDSIAKAFDQALLDLLGQNDATEKSDDTDNTAGKDVPLPMDPALLWQANPSVILPQPAPPVLQAPVIVDTAAGVSLRQDPLPAPAEAEVVMKLSADARQIPLDVPRTPLTDARTVLPDETRRATPLPELTESLVDIPAPEAKPEPLAAVVQDKPAMLQPAAASFTIPVTEKTVQTRSNSTTATALDTVVSRPSSETLPVTPVVTPLSATVHDNTVSADTEDLTERTGKRISTIRTADAAVSMAATPEPVTLSVTSSTLSDDLSPERSAVSSTHVMNQIATHLDWNRLRRGEEVHVALHPDDLGKVVLSMTVHQGEVSIRATVDSLDVKQAMETQVDVLRQALQPHGVDIQKLDVQVSPDATGMASSNQSPYSRESFSSRKTRNNPAPAVSREPVGPVSTGPRSAHSIVDVWI